MNSSLLLSIATFTYGLASILYMVSWVFKKKGPGKAATAIFAGAALLNFSGIMLRWIESHQLGIGRAPLSNLYESLVFFSLTIAFFSLYIERRYQNRILGAFAAPLAFLSIAYASLSPDINDRIQPLIPALKSNWLIVHVVTCFLGYSAFAVAFGISLMYLIKATPSTSKGMLASSFPELAVLDEITHQMVISGFLFLSAGIVTGAVWANSAWGSYWSWDPKETWSLITWFVYAVLLHARMMRGWQGKRIAIISIVGFGAVIFTYFGVNLLPGLHSYAQ